MRPTPATLLPILLAAGTAAALPAQRLLTISAARVLYEVDPVSGAKTAITTVSSNASISAGLTYDQTTGTLYLTSTGNDSLYTVDLTNGTATLVGAYGNTSLVMHGLEFDLVTNTLYGVSQHDNGLYAIDRTTGAATLIGPTGLTSFTNLAYDLPGNTLYATNSATDSLYTIDRFTGAATLIGPMNGPASANSAAFLPGTQTLYVADNITSNLYTVDLATGAATLVGSMGGGNLLGLVWIPGSLVREAHGCGGATIDTDGNATIGGGLRTVLGGTAATGVPFVGLGFGGPLPFCSCTVGHSWSTAVFGATSLVTVPFDTNLIGVTLGIQGADLLAPGGCPAPMVAFTDTFRVTIG